MVSRGLKGRNTLRGTELDGQSGGLEQGRVRHPVHTALLDQRLGSDDCTDQRVGPDPNRIVRYPGDPPPIRDRSLRKCWQLITLAKFICGATSPSPVPTDSSTTPTPSTNRRYSSI